MKHQILIPIPHISLYESSLFASMLLPPPFLYDLGRCPRFPDLINTLLLFSGCLHEATLPLVLRQGLDAGRVTIHVHLGHLGSSLVRNARELCPLIPMIHAFFTLWTHSASWTGDDTVIKTFTWNR